MQVRYCEGHHGRFGWDEKGASNTEALCAVLTHCLMIRREKSAVLKQLPAKLRCKLEVDVPPKERKEIVAKMLAIQNDTDASGGEAARQHHPLVTSLYVDTGLAKVKAVGAHVDQLLAPADKGGDAVGQLLLFGHHQRVLDALARHLESKGVPYVRVDGQVPVELRQVQCDRFQRDAQLRVALLSISAAGVGLTLTAASVVVFAECSWEIGKLKQAEDRAHRIGQTSSVLVQYCLAEGTLDDWMWRTVERKLEVTASTVDGAQGAAADFVPTADRPTNDGVPAGGSSSRQHGHSGGGSGGGRSSGEHGADIRAWLGTSAAPAAATDADGVVESATPALRLHDALAQPPPSHGVKRGREVIDLLIDESDELEGK